MAKSPLKHVYQLSIRTSPEALWEAITSGEWTRRYFYETSVESTWAPGSSIVYRSADNTIALEGQVVESDPPRRLVTTFVMSHNPEAKSDRPSRVTWEIEQHGESCKLTLIHDDFDEETTTFREVQSGWKPILSGLKDLLEASEA